ncbi:DUF1275 domain-containing protein [Gemella sp. zg-570]|uniref:YoaK family protein n=1 Tax=Gemella sp. zg-570 TaxID=2840371 RepID=UPI001C0E1AF0|nr:YoaK family protein [Gemella sp. zg-570]QWQ38156.1 DUF1275 domain-containing protein [Gemella sp. zg-570]
MQIKNLIILNKNLPSNEQILVALLLTFVGGFFDAYTFINSKGIFANAQTGNLIFIGLEIAKGDFLTSFNYVPPVLFFIMGVIFNEYIVTKYSNLSIARYLNLSLIIQTILLVIVYLVPNIIVFDIRPLIISFVCAMQYDSFRTVNKIPFASIFCTGNLRSASEHLFRYFYKKELASRNKLILYFVIILFFFSGVIVGGIFSNIFGHRAILLTILILLFNLFISTIHDKYIFNKN